MANFLEILRHNYAIHIAIPGGYIEEKSDGLYWKPPHSNANKRAGFKTILNHFCTNIQISDWNNDFVDVRNEIVHTGDLSGDQATRYRQLYQFCNRVILALLDWDLAEGEYIRRGSLTKEAYSR